MLYRTPTKYRLIFAGLILVIILIVSALIYSEVQRMSAEHQIEAINKEQKRQLQLAKEAHYLRLLELQRDIDRKDVTLDSLEVALSQKRTRLIQIPNEVQLLRGDSLAILRELRRIFADSR